VETTRRLLDRLGHAPIVVAPRMAGAPAREPAVLRVPAVPAPTYPDFSLPLPVLPGRARRLAALAFDVIHAQHPFLLGRTALRLARRTGAPLCFTYHTLYDKYAHYVPLPRRVVARQAIAWSIAFANAADLVIAPSEALARRLAGQGVRPPISVLPTGVDVARFCPGDRLEARRRLGLPADGTLVLYVGRLDREKNLEFLLAGLSRVVARRPRVRVLLVGRGTRAGALRAEAGRLGLGASLGLAGGVAPDEVAAYYQAADLFVFASTTETQGLAVLEAMATGLAVVAVRASGTDEAVVDGVSGLLVPEVPEAFARAVESVLADPDLAAKLRAGAREAAQRFAAPALAARLVGLYRDLLARPCRG
jgi:glycosyltransferase involved in cell wall biosynthesis